MASPSPAISNLTALLQSASTGSAKVLRCPASTISRLRNLHEAERITLFTPFVPHPPSTLLPKNMDPFEPLGRSLPRRARHVPYRLEHGMIEAHADFLPSAGAVIIVICTTENVTNHNPQAFQQQVKFARDIKSKVDENKSLSSVPVVVLLITNGTGRQQHENGLDGFPAIVTCNNYTTSSLENTVRVMFGS
ncbi:hypothetical protein K491DRAFT_663784 [Lophiostoma macrostomum CBS 122681]|uniref:Uncharacterized protein n=1 Tax=Lophiostoma macrostomum CBS 122681 TaxID=1314788 RepID=A0A6A6SXV6_9PLEO|nr:hypothetical protein K491DRAFT_663784 [Lophiostoma macrostomum CBS 122681]